MARDQEPDPSDGLLRPPTPAESRRRVRQIFGCWALICLGLPLLGVGVGTLALALVAPRENTGPPGIWLLAGPAAALMGGAMLWAAGRFSLRFLREARERADHLRHTYGGVLRGAVEVGCRPYAEFAQRVGGPLTEEEGQFLGVALRVPEAVAFSHRGADARLYIESRESEGPDLHQTRVAYTRLAFDLPGGTTFECRVYPQGLLATVGGRLGLQDVQVGWPEFDGQFVVRTNNETMARSILGPGVQEALLEFASWLRHQPTGAHQNIKPALEALSISGDSVELVITGELQTADSLMDFYAFAGRIYDAVSRPL